MGDAPPIPLPVATPFRPFHRGYPSPSRKTQRFPGGEELDLLGDDVEGHVFSEGLRTPDPHLGPVGEIDPEVLPVPGRGRKDGVTLPPRVQPEEDGPVSRNGGTRRPAPGSRRPCRGRIPRGTGFRCRPGPYRGPPHAHPPGKTGAAPGAPGTGAGRVRPPRSRRSFPRYRFAGAPYPVPSCGGTPVPVPSPGPYVFPFFWAAPAPVPWLTQDPSRSRCCVPILVLRIPAPDRTAAPPPYPPPGPLAIVTEAVPTRNIPARITAPIFVLHDPCLLRVSAFTRRLCKAGATSGETLNPNRIFRYAIK